MSSLSPSLQLKVSNRISVMTTSGEVSRKAFENFESPLIAYGRSFPEICRKYVEQTFKVSRTYVLVGRTLANQTPALKQLQEALGDKIVGTRVGMTPHTLFSECLQVIHECRRLDADFIIVLGAGSLADAGKLVAFVSEKVHYMTQSDES